MVAGVTHRVRLLTHVYVLAYRHPLVAAKAFATLDAISGGRVVAGVGVGHVEAEFAALGADYAGRGRVLDESIDVLAAALSDEYPEVTTPRFAVSDMAVSPRPVQRPRPPIWVGGSSAAAIRRAAERGDGWLPQGTPAADMPPLLAALHRHRERARPGEPMDVTAMVGPFHVGQPTWDVGPRTTTGTAEEIAEHVRPLFALGVNHLMVGFRTRSCDELVDQVRTFGADVAPCLA
jgi:probable F420-dependent oxidoreductase